MRRLRRLFNRASPDQNEVNILRGILSALAPDAWPPSGRAPEA
jgi:tRNA C32,U32 (ribose-2'-O)-methylase TrmJ